MKAHLTFEFTEEETLDWQMRPDRVAAQVKQRMLSVGSTLLMAIGDGPSDAELNEDGTSSCSISSREGLAVVTPEGETE